MTFPNWFKISWWAVLSAALSYLLLARMPDMSTGRATAPDVAFAIMWFALVLVPIFSEIKFGALVELKQSIAEAKKETQRELAELRIELKNAVDVRTNIAPQFYFPQPPRDEQLPQLEEKIRAIIADVVPRSPHQNAAPPPALVNDDVRLMFETRYGIEVELRRLASLAGLDSDQRRSTPAQRVVQTLVQQELIPLEMGNAIRQIYAVCSPAIHGVSVTSAQVAFVRDVGASTIQALRALPPRVALAAD